MAARATEIENVTLREIDFLRQSFAQQALGAQVTTADRILSEP